MKNIEINPFICHGYRGNEYFCDRIEESERIIKTLQNGRNITLISPRRLGKTGLIWNTFHQIKRESKDAVCVYIDIFPTIDQRDFVNTLGSAVLNSALSKGKALGKKVLEVFGALRPVLGIDNLTGMPNVTVNIDPALSETSLASIFKHLGKIGKEVYIAIDEFQQISAYPEKGTEALLRSHIQFTGNVHFIFSGSRQHLMTEMFMSPKRPFYQSTDVIGLKPLDESIYYTFANNFFEKKGGHLASEVFHELYATFDGYTWYIQSVLNRLYECHKKVDSIEQLQRAILSVTMDKATQYESIPQFLTANQFAILKAIAAEGTVKEPSGQDFLRKYRLPGASSVKTAIETLTDKEVVYRSDGGLIVYDRFLDIWLRRL